MRLKIIIPILLGTISLLIWGWNYRTPSKTSFETITRTKLPNNVIVIHDNFESMGADFSLEYKFQLECNDYSNYINHMKELEDWEADKGGLKFKKKEKNHYYDIKFIPDSCTIIYSENLI